MEEATCSHCGGTSESEDCFVHWCGKCGHYSGPSQCNCCLCMDPACLLNQPGCEVVCGIQDAQEGSKIFCENSEGLGIPLDVGVPAGSSDGPHPSTAPKQDGDGMENSVLFKCDACGKMCISKYLLKIHKRVHINEDPFMCKSCGKRFRSKGNLKIHIRTHTGEKPYSCGSCGMQFTQKGTMERHLRTHTGEKPYGCHLCTRSFSTQYTLKNHIRTHTGERPYECNSCYRKYGALNQLIAHRRIHTGEKPFSCEVCGKRFRRKDTKNYHLRTCGTGIVGNT